MGVVCKVIACFVVLLGQKFEGTTTTYYLETVRSISQSDKRIHQKSNETMMVLCHFCYNDVKL